jgi:hypothetical protein
MGVGDFLKKAASVAVAPGYLAARYGKKGYDHLTKEPASATEQRNNLNSQGDAASEFAGYGQRNYAALTDEASRQRDAFRRLASGEDSLSSEQLRQGLSQNMAAQRSMAASASPANSPMASLHAAQNMGRLGAGMSGQAAIAGIQERAQANKALSDMIMGQRQQDAQVAMGSRQNATTAYGGIPQEKSNMEKAMPFIDMGKDGLTALAMMSDRRLKTDIEDGTDVAERAVESLRPYSFKYRDTKHGKGKQLGVMAQDLERAGLKHVVYEEREGKAIDPGKLSAANTAMLGALARKVAELEGDRRKGDDHDARAAFRRLASKGAR